MTTAVRRRLCAMPSGSRFSISLSDLTLAAVVFAAGLATVATYGYPWSTALPAPAVAAAAVALRRRAPAVALAAVALSALLQRSSGTPLSTAQLAMFLVLYGAAAYGRRPVLWLSGAVVVALSLLAAHFSPLGTSLHLLVTLSAASATPGLGRGAILWLIVLSGSAPSWLFGLLRRASLSRRDSLAALALAQAQTAAAAALAAEQQQRAALARDVHDVVGHSLAVIIALSESVRFRDLHNDKDATEVVRTVGLIADSARESLSLVRDVLAHQADPTDITSAPMDAAGSAGSADGQTLDLGRNASLLELFQRVRLAGLTLEISHSGEPQDLPDGHRRTLVAVIQELLTNALHHADTDQPVRVRQEWTRDELVVIVSTALHPASVQPPSDPTRTGLGIPGIRMRLGDIHGTLRVRTETRSSTSRYVSEVLIPINIPATLQPQLDAPRR
jgi:signal transduction histidine kinase